MELRDYLSPGEYILALIRNVKVTNNIYGGEFRNIAVTNKRIILFNTKKTRLLRKTDEVSDMKSFLFEGNRWIMLHYWEEGGPGKIKWILVHIGGGTFKISSGIGRTSPYNVLTTLIRAFEALGMRGDSKSENQGNNARTYDITFTFPE